MPTPAEQEYLPPPPEADTRDFSFHPADPDAARTLSADQVRSYNSDGFISPVSVFGAAETAEICRYVNNLIDGVVSAPDRRNSYSIVYYHLVCQGLYDLVLDPRLLDLAEDLIGPNIICWGTQVFCKLPGDPMAVPLHQDALYWPFTSTKSVSVWLALDDVDETNAAMSFASGSHLVGSIPHEVKPLDGTRVLRRQAVGVEDRFPGRHVNRLGAGELSLHSDLLLHGSPPNRSERRRGALTIRYTSAEVGVDKGGEAIYGPVVHCRGNIASRWPNRRRPVGEHPEKMAEYVGIFDGQLPEPG